MAVAIAMLRGVNVGGNNKLPMEALRALCVRLGLSNIQTYIQSGNLVFHHDAADAQTTAHALEDAIHRKFGFKPSVVLRTPAELRKVVANNPFEGRPEVLPNRLLVVFLASTPTPEAHKQVLALPSQPEELHFHGRELYIFYPNGMARPVIAITRIEKLLQCPTTARNWNTVNKLLTMAEQPLH